MTHLLNTSNLHAGGGVQVGASVLSELAMLSSKNFDFSVLMSSEVAANMRTARPSRSWPFRHEILDVHGFDLRNRAARKALDGYDTVLTLFGPLYRWRPPFRSIVGFAQAWIIYPDNECYALLSFAQRLKTRLKFRIQRMFFQQADALIVELEHVKAGLVRELGIAPERIHVIHNCLSSIYHDESSWEFVTLPVVECDLRLGFVGRNYLHKNTAIFPAIAEVLRHKHGIDARFYVTFTDAEWKACTAEFRDACINVGPISAAQCPMFYRAVDAVVFPSLLECFSATPLEAMAMERPLFASDRAFNHDICGAHAHYFDPSSPESAAQAIADAFAAGGASADRLRAARDHAINFANPADRAKQYLSLLAGDATTT